MVKITDIIPTCYRLPGLHQYDPVARITIVERNQRDGKSMWSVFRDGNVLNKSAEWEYEPSPSNRDDEFIQRCRFNSVGEALAMLNKALFPSDFYGAGGMPDC